MITIILPTYNRLALLQKAIESCMSQTVKMFDLLIIDNCSSDGTQEYLKNLNLNDIKLTIIINEKNIGPKLSLEKAINASTSRWITILSDDDYFEDNFIEESLHILKTTKKGIISVGFRMIDASNNTLKTFLFNRQTLDASEAIIKTLNFTNTIAGISGFFFLNKNIDLKDYPRGFFGDMYLYIKCMLEYDGLEVINKILYNKLQWENNESAFSIDNWKLFFEASILFHNDLEAFSKNYKLNKLAEMLMTNKIPIKVFLRAFILPIFFRGIMTFTDLKDIKSIVLRNDNTYMKYYLIFVIFYPFLTKHSLKIRRNLYKILKYFLKSQK